MLRIRDLLISKEDLFVGRTHELDMMKQELLDRGRQWFLLHFYGKSGIGKTALLKRFTHVAEASPVFYMDGQDRFFSPEDFLMYLHGALKDGGYAEAVKGENNSAAALAEVLNRIASVQNVVLLFDMIDNWTPIVKWLLDSWLPLLSINVRVCTTGQYELEYDWLRKRGWNGLIRSIKIDPLNQNETYQYLQFRGVNDNRTQHTIERMSRGIPLALTLICDNVLEHGPKVLSDEIFRRKITTLLLHGCLKDLTPFQRRLLDTAALFLRFDQDILEQVLETEIGLDDFTKLCRLPFVSLSEIGGWSCNDSVRRWIITELQQRTPEKYTANRDRALRILQKRLLSVPIHLKTQTILELLHVNNNEKFKSFIFTDQTNCFRVQQAEETDIPILQKLFQAWITTVRPYLSDEARQERLIHPIWLLASSSFVTFRTNESIAAFYAFTQLDEKTRPVFQGNPVYRKYIENSPLQEKEYLFWMEAFQPQYGPETLTILLRHLFSEMASDKLVVIFTPVGYISDVFIDLGFKRIPWADYNASNGWYELALQLDLRKTESSPPLSGIQRQSAQETGVVPDEFVIWIKAAMNHYHTLESEAQLLKKFHEIKKVNDSLVKAQTVAAALRRTVLEFLDSMANGTEEDQLLEKILRFAYIQKIGPHKTVAFLLNLSMSTYYRYLKKSFHRLAIYFYK